MRMQDVPNSKELKVFAKGAFVLIGLIFILSFGIIAILLHFDRNIETSNNREISKNFEDYKKIEIEKKVEINKKNIIGTNLECKVIALIFFLVCFPIIVFILAFLKFSCLVKSYYENLYGSDGFVFKMRDIEMKELEIQKNDTQKIEIQNLRHKLELQDLEQKIEMHKLEIQHLEMHKHDSDKILDEFFKNLDKIIDLFSKWKDNNGGSSKC